MFLSNLCWCADEEEETESQEPIFRSYELEFDIKKYTEQWAHSSVSIHNYFVYAYRFANNKIVRVYSLALAGFRDNTDQLNHAIVKMLHRIAVRHNMVAMLFQVSVFRILSTVLNELPLPRYKVSVSLHGQAHVFLPHSGAANFLSPHCIQIFHYGTQKSIAVCWTTCLEDIKKLLWINHGLWHSGERTVWIVTNFEDNHLYLCRERHRNRA